MVTIRSEPGTYALSAFSSVVFPEPVPPEITTFSFDTTHARRNAAAAAESVPVCTRSAMSKRFVLNLRIVIVGLLTAIGGSTTLTREPSGSRASTIGEPSSRRRPSGATMRSAMRRMCCVSRKRAVAA